MTEIYKFRLPALTNNAHFEYMTEFSQLTAGKEADLKIAEDFARFQKLYNDEDEALLKIRKSNYTEEKQEADNARDQVFAGMTATAKGALKHFIPEIQSAAKRVCIVLDNYGNIAPLGMKEESSAAYNLIQELRKGDLANDVVAIGLTAWVDELEKRNQAVQTLEDKQYDEAAAKTALVLREVRKEIDTVVRSIWKRLDALMLIEGEAPYADYVRQLNERNTKYATIIAQKAGARAARKDKNEGEEK